MGREKVDAVSEKSAGTLHLFVVLGWRKCQPIGILKDPK